MPHNATASARHSNHVNRGHKDHLAKRFYHNHNGVHWNGQM